MLLQSSPQSFVLPKSFALPNKGEEDPNRKEILMKMMEISSSSFNTKQEGERTRKRY
jgi:hypothetical protein